MFRFRPLFALAEAALQNFRSQARSWALLGVVGAGLIGASVVNLGWAIAAAPIPVTPMADVFDLIAEIDGQISTVRSLLESADGWKDNAEKVHQAASMTAVASQALLEHEQDAPLKGVAAALRDAAITLAGTKEHAEAATAFEKLSAVYVSEQPIEAAAEYDWAKLTKMHPSMEEMNARGALFRKQLKRTKDHAAASRHATAIALLAIATHADTHEVKNEGDIPEWQALATELQVEMTAAAKAMREKDVETAGKRFALGMETCTRCHEKFQE